MSINKDSLDNRESYKLIEKEIASAPVLKAIFDSMPSAVNLWDEDMVNIMCNKHTLEIFNIKSEKEFLENFNKFSPQFQPNGKTSLEMAKINLKKADEEGANVFNWMHKTLDGENIPCEVTLVKIDEYDEQNFIVGYVRDLRSMFSQIYNIDKEFNYYFSDSEPNRDLLSDIYSLASECFFSINLRTGKMRQYLQPSPFGSETFFFVDDLIKNKLVHEEDLEKYKKLVDNFSYGIFEPCDIRFLDDKGKYRYYRFVCKIINDRNATPIFVIGKIVDVHDQTKLMEQSQKDLLTNCYNRVSSENIITEKLTVLKDNTHALFIIDIDNFKAINDNLGHFFGDEVLKEISDVLHSVFRGTDVISRIGGDEFIVFLESINDKSILEEKAEKLLEIFNRTYFGEFSNYSVSGSVGLALYPKDGRTYDELYQNADKALYQAKLSGKNRYVTYTEELNDGTMRNLTKIENADKIASSYFDYDLISAIFNILYEHNGDDESINSALKHICVKYNADRSYIFESLDDGETYDNTYEWCKENISSEINNLQGLPKEILAEFIEKAHNGIIYSNDLRETLQYDSAYKVMDDQGILSFVHAQVKKDELMTFFIGLDDCTKTRIWSEKEINSLQYIGKLISIILQGRHLSEKVSSLAQHNNNSAHILNSTDDVIYISDTNTYELLYLNRACINLIGNPPKELWFGKKCYNILQGLENPCDFCTNHLLTEKEFYEWSYYNPMLGKTFLLKDKLIPFDGRLARLEIATDISRIISLEKELKEKLDDEVFLSNCVGMLHSGKEPASSIYKLLESVLNYYEAERSYIFELSECGNFISNTYEWCGKGIKSFKDNMQMLTTSELGLLFESCKEQLTFLLCIDDIQESIHSIEHKLMSEQGIDKLLMSPIISAGDKVTGFVGVDNPMRNLVKKDTLQSVAKFIATFLDETEFLQKLNRLSYYDTLTGLKNRHSYNEAIKRLNLKHIDSLGIVYIDIKGLGEINDAHGTFFGDTVLKKLARILSSIFSDEVFRVGGDEFIVFSENSNEALFESKIDTLKRKLDDERAFSVTVGYTWNHNYSTSADDQLHYSGSEKYKQILTRNLEMEIKNNKFVVFLQPQVDLNTKNVTSAEALIRRVGAEGTYQPPITFIPFYEKEGIISNLDIFVFETVCQYLKSLKESGNSQIKSVAVNCSRMTISKEGIVEIFSNLCNQYGVDRSQILIEITETTNAISENVLMTIIHGFKEAGFSISLDDFGSGYSNLTSFVISDFDEVKIDMKLIDHVHQNEKSRTLTEVVLILCQKLENLVSVAEGIECIEQYEILKQMGCNKGQGYYFDKPMPISDFTKKYIGKDS